MVLSSIAIPIPAPIAMTLVLYPDRMNLRDLKDRFLAIPWVYDSLRPLVAGGIDLKSLARFCALESADRVFDLGCGTAQLLRFLSCEKYLGADLDSQAVERALRYASESVRFMQGDQWDNAYRDLHPTVVLMIGVVHHVSDAGFASIIGRLRGADPPPGRVVTIDVTYFPEQTLNNLLSRMDRGRFVREPQGYDRLYAEQGLRIVKREILPTRLRYVSYLGYHLSFT